MNRPAADRTSMEAGRLRSFAILDQHKPPCVLLALGVSIRSRRRNVRVNAVTWWKIYHQVNQAKPATKLAKRLKFPN